ncbi:MAG TPA: hypothetical protein P5567_05015 [Kiritimatiellia bacterium]|nr:hypothetical protein [Kiritimatiellia bacterium]HRZ11798.1 hypothetical protein [Kiritimatiellia bacterium]HSA17396.1 hypothetical protein [Kiritimatiellia bacterium]
MRSIRQIAGRAALASLVPLTLFGIAELALRVLDLGYPTEFLLETTVRGRAALVDNPFYGYRFFTPALARNPAPILTSRDKPADTVRVVVLGESAAQGDPLMQFGLPRMLQTVLNGAAATGRFEVINAAMTAINSSVIVDIARETTACRPDLYVLYIGNNEVIGPYGPGTVFTALPGLTRMAPWRVSLTGWRLAFFLREGLTSLFPSRPGSSKWSGLAMFSERPVPFGDRSLGPMYDLFERNIRAIVNCARDAGAQVILSTVAVNLSDCPPFGGPEAASAFALAREQQDRAGYKKARDLDIYRFRTDGMLNERLRKLAGELRVPLADAERAFDDADADADFFVDHVHFTFSGTHRLASTIAGAVAGLYPGRFPPAAWPDEARCRGELFYTPWSELQMAMIMLDRRRQPPFDRQPDNAACLLRLEDEAKRLSVQIAQTDPAELASRYEALKSKNPEDFFLPFDWGAILSDRSRWADAAEVLLPALELVPLHFEARKLPALALCRSGKTEEAAGVLLGPEKRRGYFVADYALEIMGLLAAEGQKEQAAALGRALLEKDPRLPWHECIEAMTKRLEGRRADE